MARILVAYFSRSGTTHRVALDLVSALDADREEITERVRRRGIIGYARSAVEATLKSIIDLNPTGHDVSAYDVVVIGTPVWNGSMSSPVRSFIRNHRADMKAVALFCTYGGRGAERALAQMKRACAKEPVAALALRESDVWGGARAVTTAKFVTRVLEHAEPAPKNAAPAAHAPLPSA